MLAAVHSANSVWVKAFHILPDNLPENNKPFMIIAINLLWMNIHKFNELFLTVVIV